MTPIILTVDDNEIHSYALVRILKSAGFDVIHAHTGTEALTIAVGLKPNAIVLDVNLPDLNGFEVCLRIKDDPLTRDIPVIFHTATSPTATARGHAESVGASAFLTYPIDPEHLITVVRGSLAHKAPGGSENGSGV
jgi:CheY-like chemotaxis protein